MAVKRMSAVETKKFQFLNLPTKAGILADLLWLVVGIVFIQFVQLQIVWLFVVTCQLFTMNNCDEVFFYPEKNVCICSQNYLLKLLGIGERTRNVTQRYISYKTVTINVVSFFCRGEGKIKAAPVRERLLTISTLSGLDQAD